MHAGAEVSGRDHRSLGITLNVNVRLAISTVIRTGDGGGQRGELARLLRHRVLGVPRGAAAAGLLHVEERELALRPILPPAANQRAHQGVLVHARDGRAALALVPEHTADGVADEPANVRLVEMADLAAGRLAGLGGRLRFGRRVLLRGLRGFDSFRPREKVGLIFLLRHFGLINSGEFRDQLFARRISIKHFVGQPITRRRAAHRAEHQADGHIQLLLQLQPERQQDRAEARHRLRRGLLPDAAASVDVANLRIRPARENLGQAFIGLGVTADRPLHVRLPGSDPHLAHQHVL